MIDIMWDKSRGDGRLDFDINTLFGKRGFTMYLKRDYHTRIIKNDELLYDD
jgi:hypothetical protein